MPATTFRSGSGASVNRIKLAPISGPAARTRSAPTPTSDATRSQRPRTSSELRRSPSSAERSSSSTTWASRIQRTAIQIATGISTVVRFRAIHTTTANPRPPRNGRTLLNAIRYARIGPLGRPSSISTSAQAVAAWTSARPSRVSVVPIPTTSSTNPPADSPVVSTPTRPSPPRTRACSEADERAERYEQEPDSEKQLRVLDVHPARSGQGLTPAAPPSDTERRSRTPRRPRRRQDGQDEEGRQHEERQPWVSEQPDEAFRDRGDRRAEEVGRTGSEDASGRHRVAAVPPALGPLDRLRPL